MRALALVEFAQAIGLLELAALLPHNWYIK